MRRIDFATNLVVQYPEDVAVLRGEIAALQQYSDYTIQFLYHNFSETVFCASWLILDKETTKEFSEWLMEDIEEEDFHDRWGEPW